MKRKVKISEQAQAAIAAGAPVEQVLADLPQDTKSLEDNALEAQTNSIDETSTAAPTEEGVKETQATDGQPPAAPATPVVVKDDALTAYLQAAVKEKDEQVVTATLKIAELTASLTAATATQGALTDIAREAVSRMQIALGGAAPRLDHLHGVTLVEEYARVRDAFAARFKVGGVAEVAQEEGPTPVSVDPVGKARVGATQLKTKRS